MRNNYKALIHTLKKVLCAGAHTTNARQNCSGCIHQYQNRVVDNYLVFYVVYDSDGIVEIRRILYGKRNYEKLL